MLLIGLLFLQVGIVLFNNVECLHSRRPSFSFVFQLLVAQIGYLFKPKSGLDSLKERG